MRELFAASVINAAGLVVRFATGLLTNKMIALIVGPSGLAVYGQLQSLQALFSGFAMAPGQSGIIRLTAASRDDPDEVYRIWSAALKAVVWLSAALAATGMLLSPWLAEHVLSDRSLAVPLMVLMLLMPAVALTTLLTSCANGMSDIRGMTVAGIFATMAAGAILALAVWRLQLPGAIAGVAIGQLATLVVTWLLLSRREWFSWSHFRRPVDDAAIKQVLGLAGMTFVAVVCVPLSQLAVRHFMVEMSGWSMTGYWQAVTRLGDMYVFIFISLLSIYYLPKFSAIRHVPELHAELRTFFTVVFPLFVLGYAVILVLRHFIIATVFTRDFLPAADLFPAQMAADCSRILAWLAGYLLMARGSPRFFMITEAAGSAVTVVLSWVLIRQFGVSGAQYAAMTVNLGYTAVLAVHLRRKGNV